MFHLFVGIMSGLVSIAHKHVRLEALAQLVCGTRDCLLMISPGSACVSPGLIRTASVLSTMASAKVDSEPGGDFDGYLCIVLLFNKYRPIAGSYRHVGKLPALWARWGIDFLRGF